MSLDPNEYYLSSEGQGEDLDEFVRHLGKYNYFNIFRNQADRVTII